jgi:competence protein ComEA
LAVSADIESFIERAPDEQEILAKERARTRMYVALAALVSLFVGAAIGYYGKQPAARTDAVQLGPPPGWEQACAAPPSEAGSAGPTGTPAPLSVYVSGAVQESQVVTLPVGSLVADALDAAGGPAPNADLSAVNLAAPVANHQQILIPSQAQSPEPETKEPESKDVSSTEAPDTLDLNRATAEELQTLPGIGASRAQDIIAYRESNGPFQRIEEIQDVSGIGEGIFAQIEPYITVGTGE